MQRIGSPSCSEWLIRRYNLHDGRYRTNGFPRLILGDGPRPDWKEISSVEAVHNIILAMVSSLGSVVGRPWRQAKTCASLARLDVLSG